MSYESMRRRTMELGRKEESKGQKKGGRGATDPRMMPSWGNAVHHVAAADSEWRGSDGGDGLREGRLREGLPSMAASTMAAILLLMWSLGQLSKGEIGWNWR